MKIAIDIRSAGKKEKTGKGYYTRNLVKALLKEDKENEYILYSDKKCDKFPNMTIVKGKSIFWHLKVLRQLKKDKPDIYFSPTSYIVPALAPKWLKVIFTVHDLVSFIFPHKHNKKATFAEKITLKHALRKAKTAICVSMNTKQDLEDFFDYSNCDMRVVYCACGDNFKKPTSQGLENVKSKYKLPEKFILGVGTLEPRKNFVSLISAFEEVGKDIEDLHLVIIGGVGWQTKEIFKSINKSNLKDKIILSGYVDCKDLPVIYNLAQIFIFPSIYEGFGIPPLEAMKCGCPVICSNSSSLPEVVGDATYLISPHKEDEITKGIRVLLSDRKFANHLIEKGLKQAEKFSWEKSAKELLKIFVDVHSRTN